MQASRRKKLPKKTRENVLKTQRYTCANKPGNNWTGCGDFVCPKWIETEFRGTFNTDGIHFDHITPYSISLNDDKSNIQALCPSCHAHKTGTDGYTNEDKIIEYEKKVHNFIRENSKDCIEFSKLLNQLTDDLLKLLFCIINRENNFNMIKHKKDVLIDEIITATSIKTIKKIINENKTYFSSSINDIKLNTTILNKYISINYNNSGSSYEQYLSTFSSSQLIYLCKLHHITGNNNTNQYMISKLIELVPYINILNIVNNNTNKKYSHSEKFILESKSYFRVSFIKEKLHNLDTYYGYKLNFDTDTTKYYDHALKEIKSKENYEYGNSIIFQNIYYKGDNINDIIEQLINYFGFTQNINYVTDIIIKLQKKNKHIINTKHILLNENKIFKEQAKNQGNEIQILTNENKIFQEQIKKQCSEIKILTNQNKKIREQHDQQIHDNYIIKKKYKQLIKNIQNENDNSIIVISKLQQELDEYKNSLKEFHENNDELQQELDKYKNLYKQSQNINDDLQQKNNELVKNNILQQEIIKGFYDSHVNNHIEIDNDKEINNDINNNILQNPQQTNTLTKFFSLFGY